MLMETLERTAQRIVATADRLIACRVIACGVKFAPRACDVDPVATAVACYHVLLVQPVQHDILHLDSVEVDRRAALKGGVVFPRNR